MNNLPAKTSGKAVYKPRGSAVKRLRAQWEVQRDIVRKDNLPLFRKRVAMFNRRSGIREGDYIKEKNGNFTRVTHIWRDEKRRPFQIQTGGSKFGQYYLGDGYVEYSGSLDHGYEVPKTKLKNMGYEKLGNVWFFRNNYATAGGGIDYMMKFRVFKVV